MDRTQGRAAHREPRASAQEMETAAMKGSFALAESLRQLAATEVAFFYKTKAAHWTVYGPNFRELHLALDEQADVSREAIDELAERCVQIEAQPPLGLEEVRSLARVQDRAPGPQRNREIIAALANDYMTVIELYRETIRRAEEEGDPTTVDLLSELLRRHEKIAWMLRTTLRQDVGAAL